MERRANSPDFEGRRKVCQGMVALGLITALSPLLVSCNRRDESEEIKFVAANPGEEQSEDEVGSIDEEIMFFMAIRKPPPPQTEPKIEQILPSCYSAAVRFWWDNGNISKWAENSGIDPLAVATLIQIETCGHPGLTSTSGAMGLFQVMPFHFKEGEDGYEIETNANAGLGYYSKCLQTAYDKGYEGLEALVEAAKGYNAGCSTVGKSVSQKSQAGYYIRHFRGFMTGDQEAIDLFYSLAKGMCATADAWAQTPP